jgi:bifunctional non-homologous end joining protein LigD
VEVEQGAVLSDRVPFRVSPMLATLVDAPFHRPGWVYEEKYDGYRILAYKEGAKVTLCSRNGKDWTANFPDVAADVARLRARTLLLDGEVVGFDQAQVSRFQLLQQGEQAVVYAVFDCLYRDGRDLRREPLARRRATLELAIRGARRCIASRRLAKNGLSAYALAHGRGLEGVVAKDAEAPYVEGRSTKWLKVKVHQEEELVIGGYTAPGGTRAYFGALLLGAYDADDRLRYVGKVGTGFSVATLADLHGNLQPLVTPAPPFVDPPREKTAVWLKPKLVAQVAFHEWTEDRKLRHPVFLGLRKDKSPRECRLPDGGVSVTTPRTRATRTRATTPAPLPIIVSNPDKVFWPEEGYTKLDLVRFYAAIFPKLQPYVKDRLLSLKRCPNGMLGSCFFQKEKPPTMPADTPTKTIRHSKVVRNYVIGGSLETQLALANLGCIAVHVWGSRAAAPRKPDWVCFDLDPDSGKFADAARAGLRVKAALDALELRSFAKTSGKKGLHVFVPIEVGPDADEVRGFAERLGTLLARSYPDELTMEFSIAARRGRVYLDPARNGFAQTVAAPWCVRRAPHAPVSTPLAWSEVDPKLDPASFNIATIAARVKRRDPWADFFRARQSLRRALAAVEKL